MPRASARATVLGLAFTLLSPAPLALAVSAAPNPALTRERLIERQAPRIARDLTALAQGLQAYLDQTGQVSYDAAALSPHYVFWPTRPGGASWSAGAGTGPGGNNAWVCLSGAASSLTRRAMVRAQRYLAVSRTIPAAACGARVAQTQPRPAAVTYWLTLTPKKHPPGKCKKHPDQCTQPPHHGHGHKKP